MIDPVKNFANVAVSTLYNDSATSIVLSSGGAAKLPDPSVDGAFNLVWYDSTNYPAVYDDPNVEIVRVTAIASETLTVTRAQESTTASTKNTTGATYRMMLAPTAKTITDIETDITAAEADITTLQSDVTTAEGNITTLQTDVTAAEAAITTLQTDVTTAEGNITTLQTDVTTAEGNITTLQTDVTAAEADIATLQGEMTTAQSDITALESGKLDATIAQDFNMNGFDILGAADIAADTNTSGVVALGAMGATEVIDWSAGTYFTATVDSDVTITHSNEVTGRTITLFLTYDGSAQRIITWSDVDEWANGEAPSAPSSTDKETIVTLIRVGTTVYGFHNTSGGAVPSDHGGLTGLTDDDHTQYAIISTGAGVPGSTPSREGAVYVDTTNDDVYMAKGTASSADWVQVNGSGGTSDHGSLTGLTDDDHTQYAIISSGAGVPGSTPTRVGALYIDTTNDNVYIATDTASSADWTLVSEGGSGDHGALSGLTDDDHTQYAIISSGAGSPSSTPVRIGAVYIDTTNSRTFFGFGTSSYSDWRYVDTTANPYAPVSVAYTFQDDIAYTFQDGTTYNFVD